MAIAGSPSGNAATAPSSNKLNNLRLVLDGSLEAALKFAVPEGKSRFVLATFGNLGVKDQLANFVQYCGRAGAAHIVGAVDVGAFDLMVSLGSPTYKTPLANEAYRLDGSNQHSSGSWKKFAGMRTGEVARIVLLGYTVLHTDCDVVFLRDPAPYIMCPEGDVATATGPWGSGSSYPCAPMREADVAVSSDNMSPDRDAQGHAGYAAGGTFNTGLLLVRPTAAGRRFVADWHRLVVEPPRGSPFAALTSDQQVFNHMMRKEREWPGVSAPHGAWVMDGNVDKTVGWERPIRLGALPLPLFINGHGYFVQSAHRRLKVDPIAVHATYSLDNHDALAKTQRFREAGLWTVDPPEYHAGRYLALNHTLAPSVQAAVDKYVKRGEPPSNIDVHGRALASYIAELRDALALATSLRRTLVLPRWTCYCDRLWSGSDDIFHFGCMYPGAQDGKFVPFVCPMDHVLSPTAWSAAGQPYRDAAFLDHHPTFRTHSGVGGVGSASIVDLRVVPRKAFDALPPAERRGVLPQGTTDTEARELLAASSLDAAAVLRLPHARDLLCGLGSAELTREVNQVAQRLLRVPQWCAKCFQPCAQELARWLGPGAGGGGRGWGMGGPNFFCLDVPMPTPFKLGECVLNGA